jgi:acylphosphatase
LRHDPERLVISGFVQGVGYRYSAHDEATSLGLRGWVRNRRDGTVEALVEGEDTAVASFVAWCQRGPRSARVDRVDAKDEAGAEPLSGFTIRPTA